MNLVRVKIESSSLLKSCTYDLDLLHAKSAREVCFEGNDKRLLARAGDPSLGKKREKRVRFTCVDAFNKKHVINAQHNEYINPNLLRELLDIADK